MALASTETVGNVVDSIRAIYLNDREGVVFNEDAIFYAVRAALSSVYDSIRMYDPDSIVETVTISYVSGTTEYTLPSDFGGLLRVRVQDSSNYSWTIPVISFAQDGAAEPSAYIREDVVGIRATGVSGTIKMDYIKRPALPTTRAATMPITDNWVQLVIFKAAEILLEARGLNGQAPRTQYDRYLSELQIVGKTRASDAQGVEVLGTYD